MKNLIAFISLMVLCGLGSDLALAKNKSKKEHPKSDVEVSALNSPVAGNEAIFEFKISKEHSVAKATYQIFAKKEMKPKVVTLEKKSNDQYEAKIDVSSLVDGDYKIKFNLFSKKGKKEHHLFGRDKKHWVNFSIKRSVVVVDPGEEGKKTLLGIDVDNNGVRDDVQVWIESKFADKPNLKNAMLQRAKYYQLEIANADNKEESIKYSRKVSDTKRCLSVIATEMSGNSLPDLTMEIIKITFNTKDRILAFKKINENFSGQVISSVSREEALKLCEFEVQ